MSQNAMRELKIPLMRILHKTVILTVVSSILLADPLWAAGIKTALIVQRNGMSVSFDAFLKEALNVRPVVELSSHNSLGDTRQTHWLMRKMSRRGFLEEAVSVSGAAVLLQNPKSSPKTASPKTPPPPSPVEEAAQTGFEPIIKGRWPYQEGFELGILNDFGGDFESVAREAIARSPEAKMAWEELQAKTLELHVLAQKHGIVLAHSDPNHTLKLGAVPFELTDADFEFIFDQDVSPHQTIDTVTPNPKFSFWGKTLNFFERLAGGVTVNTTKTLQLQDALQISGAALEVSMAAAHLVEVVDQVADQGHRAWWGVAKADIEEAQALRIQDWKTGWHAMYRSQAALDLGRQDAAETEVITALNSAEADASTAERSRQQEENILLALMRSGDQQSSDLSRHLIHPQVALPAFNAAWLAQLGKALNLMDRDSFIKAFTALVEETTPSQALMDRVQRIAQSQPNDLSAESLAWAKWRIDALPAIKEQISQLSGPADPKTDQLIRQIFLPTSLNETFLKAAGGSLQESPDQQWASVVRVESLNSAKPEESAGEMLARLRIQHHQIDKKIVAAQGKSNLAIHFGPQLNALAWVSPFALFAPTVTGQLKMNAEQQKFAQAGLDARISADRALKDKKHQDTRLAFNNAISRWQGDLKAASNFAQAAVSQDAVLERHLRENSTANTDFLHTAEARGASIQRYQSMMAEARENWEEAQLMTSAGRTAIRDETTRRIWSIVQAKAQAALPSVKELSRRVWLRRLLATAGGYAFLAVALHLPVLNGFSQMNMWGDTFMRLSEIMMWLTAQPWIQQMGLGMIAIGLALRRPQWLTNHLWLRAILALGMGILFRILTPDNSAAAVLLTAVVAIGPSVSLVGTPGESIWAHHRLANWIVATGIVALLLAPTVTKAWPVAKEKAPRIIASTGILSDESGERNIIADMHRIEPPLEISAPAGEEGIIVKINPWPVPSDKTKGTLLANPGVIELEKGRDYVGWYGLNETTLPFNLENPQKESTFYFVFRQVVDALHEMGLSTEDRKIKLSNGKEKKIPGLDSLINSVRETPGSARYVVKSKKLKGSVEEELATLFAEFSTARAQLKLTEQPGERAKRQALLATISGLQSEMELALRKWLTRNTPVSQTAWLQTAGYPIAEQTDLLSGQSLTTGRLIGTGWAGIDSNERINEGVTLYRLWFDARRNGKPTVARFRVAGRSEPWNLKLQDVWDLKVPSREILSYDNQVGTRFPGAPFGQIPVSMVAPITKEMSLAGSVRRLTLIGFFPSAGLDEKPIPLAAVNDGDTLAPATVKGFERSPLQFPIANTLEGGQQNLGNALADVNGTNDVLELVGKRVQGNSSLENLSAAQRGQVAPLAAQLMGKAQALDSRRTDLQRLGVISSEQVYGAAAHQGSQRLGSLPSGIVPEDLPTWSAYPLDPGQPMHDMPGVGVIRQGELTIKAAGNFGDAVELVAPDGSTKRVGPYRVSHIQIEYPDFPLTDFQVPLTAREHDQYLPPGSVSTLVQIRSGLSGQTYREMYEKMLRSIADRFKALSKNPIFSVLLTVGMFKGFEVLNHPLVLQVHAASVINPWTIVFGALVIVLFGRWRSKWESLRDALKRRRQRDNLAPVTQDQETSDATVPQTDHPIVQVPVRQRVATNGQELRRLKGVGPKILALLVKGGWDSLEKLAMARATDLIRAGVAKTTVARIIKAAQGALKARTPGRLTREEAEEIGWERISNSDLDTLLILSQGNKHLAMEKVIPPKWFPNEISPGPGSIIRRLTQHAGLRHGEKSADRLVSGARNAGPDRKAVESRGGYFILAAYIILILTVLYLVAPAVLMLALYRFYPGLYQGAPGVSVFSRILGAMSNRFYVGAGIGSEIFLVSQMGRGLPWVAKGFWLWITGINRDKKDFKLKMRDEHGRNLDPDKYIGQYLDPEEMDGSDQEHFKLALSALARDLMPVTAATLPDDPALLTPTHKLVIACLYDYDVQPRDAGNSVDGAADLGFPENFPTLGEAERIEWAKEALLDPERQVPALIALIQNGLIGLPLARRPQPPPTNMIMVLNALVERFKTLQPQAHDAYREASRLYQPWQSTQWIVQVIQSPPNRYKNARPAMVDALSTVFTPEDALDILKLAKMINGEDSLPKDPNLPKLIQVLERISNHHWLTFFYLRSKRVNAGIRQVLEGYINDSSNEIAGVVAYVLARRLSLVDREKAEDLLDKLTQHRWRYMDPSTYLDIQQPFLGPPPADLIRANKVGSLDLDRIIENNPYVLGEGDILLSGSLIASRRKIWDELERLLKMKTGKVRLFSNSRSLDKLIRELEPLRVNRLGPLASRVVFVESKDMAYAFSHATKNDLLISSAEPREWEAAARARSSRLYLLAGTVLDSMLASIAVTYHPSIGIGSEHDAFLKHIGVSLQYITSDRVDQLSSMVFPYSVTTIPLIPPDVRLPEDVPGGSIAGLGAAVKELLQTRHLPAGTPSSYVEPFSDSLTEAQQQAVLDKFWSFLQVRPDIYDVFREDTELQSALGKEIADHAPDSARQALMDLLIDPATHRLRTLGRTIEQSVDVERFASEYLLLRARAIEQAAEPRWKRFARGVRISGFIPPFFSLVPPVGAALWVGSVHWTILGLISVIVVGAMLYKFPQRRSPLITPESLAAVAGDQLYPRLPFRLTPEILEAVANAPKPNRYTRPARILRFVQKHQQVLMVLGLVVIGATLVACGVHGFHDVAAHAVAAIPNVAQPAQHVVNATTAVVHAVPHAVPVAVQAVPGAVSQLAEAVSQSAHPLVSAADSVQRAALQATPHVWKHVASLAIDNATHTLTVGQGNTITDIANWAVKQGLPLHGHGSAVDQVWTMIKDQPAMAKHVLAHGDKWVYAGDKLDLSALFNNSAAAAVSQLSDVSVGGVHTAVNIISQVGQSASPSGVNSGAIASAGLFLPFMGLLFRSPRLRRLINLQKLRAAA